MERWEEIVDDIQINGVLSCLCTLMGDSLVRPCDYLDSAWR